MAPSRIHKALGAVKDQTTIGLAKVSTASSIRTELEVTVVKATRHDNRPADEKHIREILNLTRYSRQSITLCVATISRRLGKTRNWTVALKALVLIHRLLVEGDPAYDEEVFFATKRGTRLLNMSEFRDRTSSSMAGSWDFSAFVRTLARYLDERLEFRMQGRRDNGGGGGRRVGNVGVGCDQDVEVGDASKAIAGTPAREMRTESVLARAQHLMVMLERFIACRPTGLAKDSPIVAVALYPLVKESLQHYYDLTEIMGILVDRFMELEVPFCVKVHDLFTSIAKQFEELDLFYTWCKNAGIARSSDYPEVEKITKNKLDLMDEFIRERSTLAKKKAKSMEVQVQEVVVEDSPNNMPEEDYEMNDIKALPPPVTICEVTSENGEEKSGAVLVEKPAEEKEVDLLDLNGNNPVTEVEHGDRLALALFDGNLGGKGTTSTITTNWESFAEEHADWEATLVQSVSNLPNLKPSLGGGFDALILNGMYQQPPPQSTVGTISLSGSASSVAVPSAAAPRNMLALPAPQGTGGEHATTTSEDPFAASTMVAPPSYVQMADMEKKQTFLVEEQVMWQRYAMDGMQGAGGLAKVQQQQGNVHGGPRHHQKLCQ